MSSDDVVMELVAWERSRSRADRIEVLEKALRATAKAVEALAFEMPPPNPYTPQFVMIAHTARAAIAEGQDK